MKEKIERVSLIPCYIKQTETQGDYRYIHGYVHPNFANVGVKFKWSNSKSKTVYEVLRINEPMAGFSHILCREQDIVLVES
jgi:hypothetical protein